MIIKFFKKLIPKDVVWLLPGLKVKRWFFFLILGTIIAFLGLCILFDMQPLYHLISLSMRIADLKNLTIGRLIAFVLIILGDYIFLEG